MRKQHQSAVNKPGASVRRKILRQLIAVTLIIGIGQSGAAMAKPDQTIDWTLNLYFENDLFSDTDEGYTNGVRASWVSPDLQDYLEDPTLPKWIRSVNQRLRFFHNTREGLQRNLIFSVGQTLYTPEDRNRQDLIVNDRPYAAWLFASMGYQTRNESSLDTLEIRLGMIGPAALGRQAQDFFHKLSGIERFDGWDNQLSNELGVLLLWEHKRKLTWIYNTKSRFGMDVISHAGITIGNVTTHLNAGAEIRIGWSIPNDFGTSAIRPGGDNSTPDSNWNPRISGQGRSWGAHLFLSLDGRIVGQDIFLDGNTFAASHRVQKERLVGDAALGFSFIYGGIKISYAQIFRSREFELQEHGHAYGSVSVSYSFR